jgi:hypothetical protein
LTTSLNEIDAERQRLIESVLPLNDRPLRPSDLPKAAAAMALAGVKSFAETDWPRLFWPWERVPYQLGTSRENLVRSAALLITAIERFDRRAAEREKHKGLQR